MEAVSGAVLAALVPFPDDLMQALVESSAMYPLGQRSKQMFFHAYWRFPH